MRRDWRRWPSSAELAELQVVLAPYHDARSEYSVVYHGRFPGFRFKTRVPLEVEPVPVVWLDDDAVNRAAAAYANKRIYCWGPSRDRVFITVEDIPGTIPYEKGLRWQMVDAEGATCPSCPVKTSKTRRGCFDHPSFDYDESLLSPVGLKRLAELRVAEARGERSEDIRQFLDEKLFVVQPSSHVTASTGDTVRFSACCVNASRYEWTFDGERSRHDLGRDVLMVRGAARVDAGEYACRALVDGVWQLSNTAQLRFKDDASRRRRDAFDETTADDEECLRLLREDEDDDDVFAAKLLTRLAQLAWTRGNRIKALYYASDAATRGSCKDARAHYVRAQAAASLGFYREALHALDAASVAKYASLDTKERERARLLRETIQERLQKDDDGASAHQIDKVGKEEQDHLRTLGFSSSSSSSGKVPSAKALRRRYLDLALQLHPDKGGDHAKFLAVQAAYESLLNKHSK